MRIKIIVGSVVNGGMAHVAGAPSAVYDEKDEKEAKRLIGLGVAEVVKAQAPAQPTRAELEAKAVELRIGTAEEVKALSDADLTKKVEEASK